MALVHALRVVFWVTLLSLFVSVLGFATHACGLWGNTYVERKVFEESYQRSESFKSRIATDQAVLVEIEAMLANPNISANSRANLQAQARAARVRINSAKAQR